MTTPKDSKTKKVDMSSEAITRRLRQTEQLRVLSLSLMKAKKISGEKSKAAKRKDNQEELKETL